VKHVEIDWLDDVIVSAYGGRKFKPGDAPLPQLGSYFVRIVTPAGKVGYVPDDTISALDNDRLCFVKDGAGWKITGYIAD
jgi:hypothetical protein